MNYSQRIIFIGNYKKLIFLFICFIIITLTLLNLCKKIVEFLCYRYDFT